MTGPDAGAAQGGDAFVRDAVQDGVAIDAHGAGLDILGADAPVVDVQIVADVEVPDSAAADGEAPEVSDDDGNTSTDVADSSVADAGVTDGGATDTGSPDAGSPDAGSADAGSADAGSADAGSADAGPLCTPTGVEICDGIDNDCNGQTDEGAAKLCDDGNSCTTDACNVGKTTACSHTPAAGGCEDGNPCTTGDTCGAGSCKAGKSIPQVDWFIDNDGDTFGSKKVGKACVAPASQFPGKTLTSQGGDCDDTDKTVLPGGKETCDGIDQDCDGQTDEGVCGDLLPPGTTGLSTSKPMQGDSWKTDGEATFDTGPFGGVKLSGSLEKTGKDAPVTWCFSGSAPADATALKSAPFGLSDVQVTICRDANGAISRTLTAKLTLDGAPTTPVTGSFSVGKAAGLSLQAKALKLLGVSTSATSVKWTVGQAFVTVAANASVTYLQQTIPGELTGKLVPAKDSALAFAPDKPTAIKTVGAVQPLLPMSAVGKRIRLGKALRWTLGMAHLGAKDAKVALMDWTVAASRNDGASWQLNVRAANAQIPPLKAPKLVGSFKEGAKSLCISGDASTKTPGASKPVTIEVCWGAGTAGATFTSAVEAPPVGAASLSGSVNAKGELCLSGTASKTFPSAIKGQIASPVTVTTCLKNGLFMPLSLQASLAVDGLGKVKTTGAPIQGGKPLCLEGPVTVTASGSQLKLALRSCASADLKAATTTIAATLTMAPFGPVGASAISGKQPGQLCFAAQLKATVTGDSNAKLVAVQCLKLGGNPVFTGPAQFSTTATWPNLGTLTLIGSTSVDGKQLCLSAPLPSANLAKHLPLKGVSRLGGSATTCYSAGVLPAPSVAVDFRVGTAQAKDHVVLRAAVDYGDTGGLCTLHTKKTAGACQAVQSQWLKNAVDPGDRFGSRYAWVGGACIDKRVSTKAACKVGTWVTGQKRRMAVTRAPLCQKKGSATCAWAAACDAASGATSCKGSWTPFVGMPIGAPLDLRTATFNHITGAVWVVGKAASMGVRSTVSSPLAGGVVRLVTKGKTTLLGLKKTEASLAISALGASFVEMWGRTDLNLTAKDMAAWPVKATVRGVVGKDRINLTGALLPKGCNSAKTTCEWPEVEPFKKVVGGGVFKTNGKGGQIELSAPYTTAKTVPFEAYLRSRASLTLPQGKKQSAEAQTYVVFTRDPNSGALATTPQVTFAVPVAKSKMIVAGKEITLGEAKTKAGKFETRPTVFVASSDGAKGLKLDLDNDMKNGRETMWDVDAGGLVRSTALLPHFGHLFANPTANVDLVWASIGKFRLIGKLDLNWILVKPSYGIPSLHSLALSDVFVHIDFPGTVRLFVGGHADVQVKDRAGGISKLTGLAQFEMDKTLAMGGTIGLSGLWKNPFMFPNMAVLNAGLSAKFRPGVPAPTAFGFTGQGLMLKEKIDAPWPKITSDKYGSPVGVNKDGTLMKKLPSNVATFGESFYFDTVPSKSGFCYAPSWCLKLPVLFFRLDVQNLVAEDLVELPMLMLAGVKTMVSDVKTLRTLDLKTGKFVEVKNPLAKLADFIPVDKALGKIDFGPISLALDRMWVYMHTHDDEHFGVDWPFGFKLALDARFKPLSGPDKGKEKKIKLRGNLDIWGATLKGWMSAMQIIPGVKLTGDPFRRYAQLGSSGEIKVSAGKQHINWGTFEGWFYDETPTIGSSASLLFARTVSGGNGITVSTKEAAPACAPGSIDLDGKKLDCVTKLPRVVVTLKTSDTKVPAAARVRVVKTRYGVMKKAIPQHIAVVKDPKTHEVAIVVDGARVPLIDTADGKDGKPGTKDDLTRFALPATGGTITMGRGFTYVDDLRLWTVTRDTSTLDREASRLEKGFHIDKELIARWEVDFDRALDKVSVAGKDYVALRNSKLDMGDAWHGRYSKGAKPVIDPHNQDLWFRLDWPIKNPFNSGWGVRAGVDLKLPKSFLKLSGNPEGITFRADLNYHAKKLGGLIYARELTVVPIPKKGGVVITGDGPDGRQKNWDDGLYALLEMRYPSSLNFEGDTMPIIDATGALAFDWEQKRQRILSATLRLGCLKKDDKAGAIFSSKPCSLGSGYHIYARTWLGAKGEIGVDLGKSLGKLALQGDFELSTLDAPVKLNMKGGVKVFGRQMADMLVRLDDKGFLAEGELDIGTNYGVNLGIAQKVAISYDWNPARLCASGQTILKVPVVANFNGTVAACFGTNPMASFEGTAKAGKFGGVPVSDLAVKLHTSNGLEVTKARLKVPKVFDGNLTGFYKTPKNFDMKGAVLMKPGTGKLFKFTSKTRLKRLAGDKATLIVNESDVSAVSGWIKATMKGAIKYAGGSWYYALAGAATLKPLGFTMADGRFWLCNPQSTSDTTIPTECKTNKGFGASALLNLGIVKLKIKGGIDTNVKIGTKTVDKLYLQGSVKVNLHKVFKLNATAKLSSTEPFVGGHNQLRLVATLEAFGAKTTKTYTLQSGANGLPKPYTLAASGTLKPFGFSLSSGKALFKWDGKITTASAAGNLNLSPILSGSTGATIKTNGSATWKGNGTIKLTSLLKSSTDWTISSKGTSFGSNFKANTKVISLGVDIDGTIPKDLKFVFGGKGWMKLYPFSKSDFATFKVSHDKGFEGTATLNLKVVKMNTKIWAGRSATGIGISGAATLSTWKIGTFVFTWVETITKTAKKKISGCSCGTCGGCWGGLPGFKCKCKQTKSSNSAVEASVTFKLSGTSYEKSSNIKLEATAKLKAGKWGGSSTTTCQLGSQPKCCFKFVSPIGTQCLKLY